MILKKFTYFYPEKPQLILIESNAFEEMSNHPDYIAQPKFNEQRCELHLIDGVGHFWDRHGKELTYNSNPAYAEGKNEIVRILVEKFGDKGYFQFDAGLRHNKVHGVNHKLVIYDIFIYKNEILNKLIYNERREILEGYFGKNFIYDEDKTVHLINEYRDNFKKVYDDYINSSEEFEGIVIKNLNGKLI